MKAAITVVKTAPKIVKAVPKVINTAKKVGKAAKKVAKGAEVGCELFAAVSDTNPCGWIRFSDLF